MEGDSQHVIVIVFETERGWSQGVSGLSYIGVMVGQFLPMFFYLFLEVKYQEKVAKNPAASRPEGHLDPALIGSVLLPIGLFWFAWSTFSYVHWIVSILGGTVFGFGQVLLFISLINYVVDAYTCLRRFCTGSKRYSPRFVWCSLVSHTRPYHSM